MTKYINCVRFIHILQIMKFKKIYIYYEYKLNIYLYYLAKSDIKYPKIVKYIIVSESLHFIIM